jgi:hypothetical protein
MQCSFAPKASGCDSSPASSVRNPGKATAYPENLHPGRADRRPHIPMFQLHRIALHGAPGSFYGPFMDQFVRQAQTGRLIGATRRNLQEKGGGTRSDAAFVRHILPVAQLKQLSGRDLLGASNLQRPGASPCGCGLPAQQVNVPELPIGVISSNVVRVMIGLRWSAKAGIGANYRKIALFCTERAEIGNRNAQS